VLAGYTEAVTPQKDTALQLGYFTLVATATNTALGDNQTAMRATGDDLIKGFYESRQGLFKAQEELAAANKIRGDLELKQTTALEGFVGAIKDVNKGAKDVLDAAGVLFAAAGNKLLEGSAKAAEAQQLAQAGMTYWGDVVTQTAAGIAASVAALSGAAGAIQSSQSANKAAADERMVREWYANNGQYQSKGKGKFVQVQQFEVDYWMNRLKTGDAGDIKQQFAIAAARDHGFSMPLDVAAFAAGGDHVGGLRLVGEQGPELEVTGPSRIFNAAQTRDILHGAASPGLAEELAALRQEVALLRREARIGAAANVSATKAQTSFWRDLTDGRNIRTKEVTA
jgi:hypothetical protein